MHLGRFNEDVYFVERILFQLPMLYLIRGELFSFLKKVECLNKVRSNWIWKLNDIFQTDLRKANTRIIKDSDDDEDYGGVNEDKENAQSPSTCVKKEEKQLSITNHFFHFSKKKNECENIVKEENDDNKESGIKNENKNEDCMIDIFISEDNMLSKEIEVEEHLIKQISEKYTSPQKICNNSNNTIFSSKQKSTNFSDAFNSNKKEESEKKEKNEKKEESIQMKRSVKKEDNTNIKIIPKENLEEEIKQNKNEPIEKKINSLIENLSHGNTHTVTDFSCLPFMNKPQPKGTGMNLRLSNNRTIMFQPPKNPKQNKKSKKDDLFKYNSITSHFNPLKEELNKLIQPNKINQFESKFHSNPRFH
jgi:hypothetical protein